MNVINVSLALDKMVPNALYSGFPEGEENYAMIRWSDERPQPTWQEIVDYCSTPEFQDYIEKFYWPAATRGQIVAALRSAGILNRTQGSQMLSGMLPDLFYDALEDGDAVEAAWMSSDTYTRLSLAVDAIARLSYDYEQAIDGAYLPTNAAEAP